MMTIQKNKHLGDLAGEKKFAEHLVKAADHVNGADLGHRELAFAPYKPTTMHLIQYLPRFAVWIRPFSLNLVEVFDKIDPRTGLFPYEFAATVGETTRSPFFFQTIWGVCYYSGGRRLDAESTADESSRSGRGVGLLERFHDDGGTVRVVFGSTRHGYDGYLESSAFQCGKRVKRRCFILVFDMKVEPRSLSEAIELFDIHVVGYIWKRR